MKLEIGSSVRPDPYSKRVLKTYIQEYLEKQEMEDVIAEYELKEVVINVLAIERTFLDKVMSVKRHAICGTLGIKYVIFMMLPDFFSARIFRNF